MDEDIVRVQSARPVPRWKQLAIALDFLRLFSLRTYLPHFDRLAMSE